MGCYQPATQTKDASFAQKNNAANFRESHFGGGLGCNVCSKIGLFPLAGRTPITENCVVCEGMKESKRLYFCLPCPKNKRKCVSLLAHVSTSWLGCISFLTLFQKVPFLTTIPLLFTPWRCFFQDTPVSRISQSTFATRHLILIPIYWWHINCQGVMI